VNDSARRPATIERVARPETNTHSNEFAGLPESLIGLDELAENLWWTLRPVETTIQVKRCVDPERLAEIGLDAIICDGAPAFEVGPAGSLARISGSKADSVQYLPREC